MAAPETASPMEDDPLVTLRQEGPMKEETGRWQVRKSKLVQHSGFFRRMFSRNCIETRSNQVTLHDYINGAFGYLVGCIEQGQFIDIESRLIRNDDELPTQCHEVAASLYQLLEKYDCPGFKADCIWALAESVRLCLADEWTTEDFILEDHYEVIAEENGGVYPEELYHIIADAWRILESKQQVCPDLDALLKRNHALLFAVAKSYQASLNRGLEHMQAAKKSMEGRSKKPIDN